MKVPWSKRFLWLLPALALLTGALYLAVMVSRTNPGFPLDDSWIHQTIARNIVQYGEYSYNPHQPMAGSTAPLWSLILAAGHILPGVYIWFTYGLGILLLALTALAVYYLTLELYPGRNWLGFSAAAFFIFDWRAGWMALSGMETIGFTFLCCLALLAYLRGLRTGRRPWVALGGLAGAAAVFLRPEAAFLLALLAAHGVWLGLRHRGALKVYFGHALVLGIIGVLSLAAYSLLNYFVSGTIMPMTFYAKSQAYGVAFDVLGSLRYLATAAWILILGQLGLLVPGLFYGLWRIFRRLNRDNEGRAAETAPLDIVLLPAIWIAGLIALYAIRLPVTYQHGRYLMPLLPFLVIYGLHGTVNMLEAVKRLRLNKAAFSWRAMVAVATLAVWIWGSASFANEVAMNNNENVAVAQWLSKNTASTDIIATHDIGAIGYFSGRQIVDSAGLITPGAIPYVRDQQKLLDFVESRRAVYFAFLPDWYPKLVDSPELQLVFEAQDSILPAAGYHPMRVYRILP